MEIRGLRRLFLALPIGALVLPIYAATTELDPLAAEVTAYVAGGAKEGSASLELAARIGWSEKTAHFESDTAKRAELSDRLAQLRGQLAAASRQVASKAGSAAALANGAISGRVTHDGAPLAEARVTFYHPAGYYIESTATGADGRYAISLPPGNYIAYATPPYDSRLSPQLFDGISCNLGTTCQPSDGTPLVLASGGHQPANFALADLGAIAGEVRRRDTHEPVATELLIYSTDLAYAGSTYADQQGAYSFGGLPPGTYWVVAEGRGELAGMIYDGVPCNQRQYNYQLGCSPLQATTVEVGLEQVVTGVDFALERGATLGGRAVELGGGVPDYGIEIKVWDSAYRRIASAYTSGQNGDYLIEGLAGGTYYLSAESYDSLTPQFFDGVDCIPGPQCLAAARPVEVALGSDYRSIDFALRKRGTLAGRITDEITGNGVEDVDVMVLDRLSGFTYSNTRTDSSGFFSLSEVPAVGILLQASHFNYLGEYFDDVDFRRGKAAAKVIAIRPGEVITIPEIRLKPRGGLEVQALAAESGNPLPCYSIAAYPQDGSTDIPWTYDCDPEGRIRLENLLPGRYFLMIKGDYHAWYLYGKGSCNLLPSLGHCDFGEGVAVEVPAGQAVSLGPIYLERSTGFRVLTTFAGATGAPPTGGRLRLYEADGDEVQSLQIAEAYPDRSFDELAAGTYRLVVDGSPNWETFAHPAAPCSRWYCDPFRGDPIVLEAGIRGPELAATLSPIPAYTGCDPSDTALCLNQGRYRVTATWHDFGGASGAGKAGILTADSGYFYFFSPNNLEVLVKTLNGCDRRLGHHFWFYGAGLTNVQVELRVVDTLTGAVEIYSNLLGHTFQPILDNTAFATCDAVLPHGPPAASAPVPAALVPATPAAIPAPPAANPAPAGIEYCQTSYNYICLGSRFEVAATYRTAGGNEGSGTGSLVTADTAILYFFDPTNIELVVKILDACSSGLPGYWVFASGLTDVAVDLTITDHATGFSKVYKNELGPFVPIIDLGSFPCN